MRNYIKFYCKDETLQYNVKQCFAKIVFQNKKNELVVEIISTDDLDHVEGDSVQIKFPEIIFTLEDFPVTYPSLEDLINKTVEIPNSFEEIKDEEGEPIEVFYTNLNLNNNEDLETNQNFITFSKNKNNPLVIVWKGTCEHFTNLGEEISFEINTEINAKNIPDNLYDE